MSSPSGDAAVRSGFVTGLAWIFIALSSFATLIGVLQNVMVWLLFPDDLMREMMSQPQGAPAMPAVAQWMLENFRLLIATFLLLCVATLVSAIGLLSRKNWARLTFMGIMGLGIAWNLAGVAIPFLVFPPLPDDTPGEFLQEFELVMKVMMAVSVVMALALSALFGWIIRKLVSQGIRREFLVSQDG